MSSPDQKADLERQKQVLERDCGRQGWTFALIADLGSGMNGHKKGLKTLLDTVVDGRIGRLVITHEERLLRFGAEPVFAICEAKRVEAVGRGKAVAGEEFCPGGHQWRDWLARSAVTSTVAFFVVAPK